MSLYIHQSVPWNYTLNERESLLQLRFSYKLSFLYVSLANYLTASWNLNPLPFPFFFKFLLKFFSKFLISQLLCVPESWFSQSMESLSDSSSSLPNPSISNTNLMNTYTSLIIQNIGSTVPIKLKWSNYLPWHVLFASIFNRYKLIEIIDRSKPCLSPVLPNRSLSLDFELWM